MARIGYALSSEEHEPQQLVENARAAEDAGFEFALISDHYHLDRRSGAQPVHWSVLGGIASATSKLEVGTGVTCPMIRTHPAIIAQAAATVGCMMPGRFFLGVGTGENLNEHPRRQMARYEVRAEMLEEAVDVIRLLWQGIRPAARASTTRSRTRGSTTSRTRCRRSTWRPVGRAPPSWPGGSATG